MKTTYNIRETQARLSKLCGEHRKFVITNRDRPVRVAMPVEEYEAMLETLDVLTDPKAMEAIRKARAGEATHTELDLDDGGQQGSVPCAFRCRTRFFRAGRGRRRLPESGTVSGIGRWSSIRNKGARGRRVPGRTPC